MDTISWAIAACMLLLWANEKYDLGFRDTNWLALPAIILGPATLLYRNTEIGMLGAAGVSALSAGYLASAVANAS